MCPPPHRPHGSQPASRSGSSEGRLRPPREIDGTHRRSVRSPDTGQIECDLHMRSGGVATSRPIPYRPSPQERWPSGLRRRSRKPEWCHIHRGFESHPLRQLIPPKSASRAPGWQLNVVRTVSRARSLSQLPRLVLGFQRRVPSPSERFPTAPIRATVGPVSNAWLRPRTAPSRRLDDGLPANAGRAASLAGQYHHPQRLRCG